MVSRDMAKILWSWQAHPDFAGWFAVERFTLTAPHFRETPRHLVFHINHRQDVEARVRGSIPVALSIAAEDCSVMDNMGKVIEC